MILDTSVSPALKAFVLGLDDDESRQRLAPLAPRLAGGAGGDQDEARAWMATDWLVRVQTPAWLRLLGRDDLASALERCAPVRSIEAAYAAQPLLDEARRVAWAAADAAAWASAGASRDAAWTVARAAAWDSAGAAAWAAAWAARDVALEAAREAARDVAWDAAAAAALDAARDAAWDAARGAVGDPATAAREAAVERLRPTLASLQASALDLFDQMIGEVGP